MCLLVLFSLSVMVGRGMGSSVAKGKVKGNVIVVDEMWTYLYTRAFYKWVFTCYAKLGLYSVGDRDENTLVKKYLPEDG